MGSFSGAIPRSRAVAKMLPTAEQNATLSFVDAVLPSFHVTCKLVNVEFTVPFNLSNSISSLFSR